VNQLSDAQPFRVGRRDVVLGIVAAMVGIAAVIVGLGRLAGFSDVGGALRGAAPVWLAGCVAGQVLVFVGYGGVLRRAIAADGGPTVPRGSGVELALASFAATQLFAIAGVAGLAVVYWALRRAGHDRPRAAVVLIGLNTAVYFVFAGIAFAAAALALASGEVSPALAVPWLVGVPALVAAATWFTDAGRVGRWTSPDPRRLRQGLAVGVGAAAWVRRRLHTVDGRELLGWAACYWVGDLVSLWAALRAFGAEPAPVALVVVYTTGYLAQAVPIPLIATAGVDTATAFLLTVVGVPLETALLGVVAHRVFAFWIPVVPGAVLAFTLPRRLRFERGAPRPTADAGP
jgi:uncharacterized membrane protein YbhN (UPF0104 family)